MSDFLNVYESKDFGGWGRAYLSVQRSVQVTDYPVNEALNHLGLCVLVK